MAKPHPIRPTISPAAFLLNSDITLSDYLRYIQDTHSAHIRGDEDTLAGTRSSFPQRRCAETCSAESTGVGTVQHT